MARIKVRAWHSILGGILAVLIVLIAVWNWDWFIPPVERIATAKLGRPVQIQHLRLHLARNPVLEADNIVIGNPAGFPAAGPFARIARLGVTVDGPAWVLREGLLMPGIEVDKPNVNAIALPDGRNNWTFPFSGAPAGKRGASPRIGDLRIKDGYVHVVDPKVKADLQIDIATTEAGAGQKGQLLAQASGTYNKQPITARFAGGAVLTLRDKTNPYPVELALANGATRVLLRGTVQDPLAFAGTDLKVELSGQSLANLTPLTGVPAPATPPYRLLGDVTYTADRHVRLDHLVGHFGNSDLEGSLAIDPGGERPQVTVDLHSHQVDLADFGGFLGATPGQATTPGETPQKRAAVAHAEASPWLIPHTQLDLPRLHAADVALHYRGDRIEGRSIPLDDLAADLTIKDGAVRFHPVSFGVGRGRISFDIAADEARPDALHVRTDVDFRQVDLARLLSATHSFSGAGTIGGRAVVDGTGGSVAGILGDGNGGIKLFMVGGDLSALLVDLSGLEFGNALLSALGLPKQTPVRCLVADLPLREGILDTRTLVVDTAEASVVGKGSINLRDETIDYQLRTNAKHFSIGSLPAPIDITGHLKHPSVRPDAKALAARGALAVGLGVLLTPLAALLPTIQLGLGEHNDCEQLIRTAQKPPARPDRTP